MAMIVLAWFVGLGSIAAMFRSILGALADWMKVSRTWLSVPGNKTRLLFVALAVGFLSAGLQSWQRGSVIIQQRADYGRLQERADWEKGIMTEQSDELHGAVAARDSVIQRFIDLAERQKELLRIASDQAAAAMTEAEAAKAAAADTERRYQEQFDNRPPECEAALQVMARACPTLKGY